jgi:hypothetical protein
MNALRIAFIVLFAQFAQAATPQLNPASVEGVVVKSGSGEPLAGMTVRLMRDQKFAFTTTTTPDGKFSLEKVTPGTYRLVATSAAGYIPAEYGQRSPTGLGLSFDLAAGQKMTGIQLAMIPAGSISGRVYDRDGEPVGKAQVHAMRSIYKDGRRTLTIVQAVETNDRGEYRLFWLPPGRYYVSAKPDIPELPTNLGLGTNTAGVLRITEPARFSSYEQSSAPVVTKRSLKTGEAVEETYVPTYYPGTIEMQEASPISLAAGAAVSGVDVSIGMGRVTTHHIQGRVIDGASGQPLSGGFTSVMAIPHVQGPLMSVPNARAASNGSFDLQGAVPGSYMVFASDLRRIGVVRIDVGNADVQNITIVVAPGFKLLGRFFVEGQSRTGTDLKMSDLRVGRFVRDPAVLGLPTGGPTFSPPPAEDGSFELQGVAPGDYRVTLQGVPQDAYIKSIRMGNADILDGGLHITGAPENPLEIVINLNAGRIDGTAVNARGEPLPNRTVALVPDFRVRHRSDLYKTTVTDASGRFFMRGLTPGDYKLFAWEHVEEGAWGDPEFIASQENLGTAVHVAEQSNSNVQLRVIP